MAWLTFPSVRSIHAHHLDASIRTFAASLVQITCLHKVYHCNFDKEGKLCLDIVRKENWSPMIGVKEVVVAIQQLLREPNVGHPLDEDIAAQMEKDPKKYEASAKKYTKQYAK